MPQPAGVTVVIPVRDRAGGLDRCLSALGTCYPVIVVDDGSLDPAAVVRVCESHGAQLHRRAVPGGPRPARNDRLAEVTPPLLAFLDSDCVTGPRLLGALAAHFTHPMVVATAPRGPPLPGPHAPGPYPDPPPP